MKRVRKLSLQDRPLFSLLFPEKRDLDAMLVSFYTHIRAIISRLNPRLLSIRDFNTKSHRKKTKTNEKLPVKNME